MPMALVRFELRIATSKLAARPERSSRRRDPDGRPRTDREDVHVGNTTLVTGGSGYIGALLVEELRQNGHDVRVLDSLLHGQEDIAAEQEQTGVQVIRADIRDADARRRALDGVDNVVHLAAIVGDP